MKIGFSGTRHGMTQPQFRTILRLLQDWKPSEVHHGGCVGADIEFAKMCDKHVPRPHIVCRPGMSARDGNSDLRATDDPSDQIFDTLTHFHRNRAIVDSCAVLIAAPFGFVHQASGGTWYTIDYARKHKKHVIIVFPDGTTDEHR